MPRKNIPKKLVKETFNRIDNPYKPGHCWHCGKKIVFKNRGSDNSRGVWQIDHFPVPYRDIENQVLIGITDPLCPKNLVPACKKCNLSHNFEIPKWYYCNYYQFPCKKKFIKNLIYFFLFIYICFITISFIFCKLK